MTHAEVLRKVEWRDLRNLSLKEMLIENNLTIPWFVFSVTLAYFGYYWLALPFSAFFLLTSLRQVHMFLIHKVTWQLGDRSYRRNMLLELASAALFITAAIYFNIPFLLYHIAIMIVGEFLMAVWTVHHNTHDHPELARTQRTSWKNKITFSMFYHLEHHLFPAVPTIKLPELAKRIDEALPAINKKNTF